MPVSDGDVLKVVVFINGPDSVIMNNVYHYRLDDPNPDNPTDAQIITAIDAEMDGIYTKWDDEMSDEYNVDKLSVDRVEWNAVDSIWETVEHIGESLLDHDGLGISDPVPHGVACNITFNTADPRRQGRKFFPGASEDGMDGSNITGAVQTVLAAMGADVLSDLPVGGGAAELTTGIATNLGTFLPFIIAVVNTIAAYQRRRKPGVGT